MSDTPELNEQELLDLNIGIVPELIIIHQSLQRQPMLSKLEMVLLFLILTITCFTILRLKFMIESSI